MTHERFIKNSYAYQYDYGAKVVAKFVLHYSREHKGEKLYETIYRERKGFNFKRRLSQFKKELQYV